MIRLLVLTAPIVNLSLVYAGSASYNNTFAESICAVAMENRSEFCKNLHEVGGYKDQNNRLMPVDIYNKGLEGKKGRAMAIVRSRAGLSNAVQVCPGVYLATAHGVLNSKGKAAKNKRPINDLKNQWISVHPYPKNQKKGFTDEDLKFEVISPMLRDTKNWDDHSKDYAFIKIGKKKAVSYAKKKGFLYKGKKRRKTPAYDPKVYITPVEASAEEIEKLSRKKRVSYIRNKPVYDLDKKSGLVKNYGRKKICI